MKTELIRNGKSAIGFRFALVVSRWNDELTAKLADGAVEALLNAGADRERIDTFYVPGSFELPLACLKAAESRDFQAVIALGVVIRGDTPHFEYVAGAAANGIMQASLKSGVPILFGVITADNIEQAKARCGREADNKGYEAALSAVEMAHVVRGLSDRSSWIPF